MTTDLARARDALKRGDWTTYGQEQQAMQSDLQQLAALEGVPIASPTVPAAPSPTP